MSVAPYDTGMTEMQLSYAATEVPAFTSTRTASATPPADPTEAERGRAERTAAGQVRSFATSANHAPVAAPTPPHRSPGRRRWSSHAPSRGELTARTSASGPCVITAATGRARQGKPPRGRRGEIRLPPLIQPDTENRRRPAGLNSNPKGCAMIHSLTFATRPRAFIRLIALPLGASALLAIASASMAGDAHHTVVSADAITWGKAPPSLPPGAQAAVLLGNPGKEGPFVLRLKFPANFVVPPHRHSKD